MKVNKLLMAWFQKEITIAAKKRGCHLIQDELLAKVPEIKSFKVGIVHVFIKHTSASLSMNENWDPSVRFCALLGQDIRDDTEMMLNKLIPETTKFKHSCEGPDDMPAHIKALFIGSSVSIPITDGRLNTGTWQGLWLCEHRNHGSSRHLVVTVQGQKHCSSNAID